MIEFYSTSDHLNSYFHEWREEKHRNIFVLINETTGDVK